MYTVEAVADALNGMSTDYAVAHVLRARVGPIGPGDVSMATLTSPPAIVLGFSVGADKGVEAMAQRENVSIFSSVRACALLLLVHYAGSH